MRVKVLIGVMAGLLLLIVAGNAMLNETESGEKVRLQIPENLSPEANKIIAESWPKVMEACPGFSKYGKDMKNTRIYDSLDATYFPAVEIYFEISDSPSTIPSDFRAFGHTCSYDINPSGTNLRIQKDLCVMVCIDGPHNSNGVDYNRRI